MKLEDPDKRQSFATKPSPCMHCRTAHLQHSGVCCWWWHHTWSCGNLQSANFAKSMRVLTWKQVKFAQSPETKELQAATVPMIRQTKVHMTLHKASAKPGERLGLWRKHPASMQGRLTFPVNLLAELKGGICRLAATKLVVSGPDPDRLCPQIPPRVRNPPMKHVPLQSPYLQGTPNLL